MNHEQATLVRPLAEEKVQMAIKRLNTKGVGGLNRIPLFFYGELWELAGAELITMLEEFLQGTASMEKINRSHIFLLPKCQGAVR